MNRYKLGKRRLCKFTKEEKLKLASLVKNYPCLWDLNDPTRSNHNTIALAWIDISEEMGKEAFECKTNWASLRDSKRYRAKQALKSKPCVTGEDYIVIDGDDDWEFADVLEFLPVTFRTHPALNSTSNDTVPKNDDCNDSANLTANNLSTDLSSSTLKTDLQNCNDSASPTSTADLNNCTDSATSTFNKHFQDFIDLSSPTFNTDEQNCNDSASATFNTNLNDCNDSTISTSNKDFQKDTGTTSCNNSAVSTSNKNLQTSNDLSSSTLNADVQHCIDSASPTFSTLLKNCIDSTISTSNKDLQKSNDLSSSTFNTNVQNCNDSTISTSYKDFQKETGKARPVGENESGAIIAKCLQQLVSKKLGKKERSDCPPLKYHLMLANMDNLLQRLPQEIVDDLHVEFISRIYMELKKLKR